MVTLPSEAGEVAKSSRDVALGGPMRIGRPLGPRWRVAGKILEGVGRVLVSTRPRQTDKGNEGEPEKPLHAATPHLKRGMTS